MVRPPSSKPAGAPLNIGLLVPPPRSTFVAGLLSTLSCKHPSDPLLWSGVLCPEPFRLAVLDFKHYFLVGRPECDHYIERVEVERDFLRDDNFSAWPRLLQQP